MKHVPMPLLVLLLLAGCDRGGSNPTSPPSAPAASTEIPTRDSGGDTAPPAIGLVLDLSNDAAVESPAPTTPWTYSVVPYEMGGNISFARAESAPFSIGFPYEGTQAGRLVVRQHPNQGLDIMLSIQRGQILNCNYGSPQVRVRFGDSPARSWSCSRAADGDSTTIFLNSAGRFLAELKRAERARVELLLYREGSLVLTFDVHGLVWPPTDSRGPAAR